MISTRISIGDYVTLQSSTGMLAAKLKGISATLNAVKENSLYIDYFRKFMDYKSKKEIPSQDYVHVNLSVLYEIYH